MGCYDAAIMKSPSSSPSYLEDTTYPDRYYRELSPTWLNYVARLGGRAPVDLTSPFTYLDLGCGFGLSTIVHAGTFPNAEFYGVDLNKQHIANASENARRRCVANVTFIEDYFERVLSDEFPDFDFIVLHGVYTWVSGAVRETIQRIVSAKLKNHGLLYLSYNCLPGWAAEAPLRRLMQEFATIGDGSIAHRTRLAAQAVKGMANHGGFRYFRDNVEVTRSAASLADEPVNYLAHEFLNDTWTLHYSVDVAEDMARANVSYAGSATLADNHPLLIVGPQVVERVAELPGPRLQQLAMDFAVNRRFRRDVFAGRDARNPLANSKDELNSALIGCVDETKLDVKVDIPRGRLTFRPTFIDDVRDLFSDGPKSISESVVRLATTKHQASEVHRNLLFLVAAGALTPYAERVESSNAPARHGFANPSVEAVLRDIVKTGRSAIVPCPALGRGVVVTASDAANVVRWVDGQRQEPPPALLRRLGAVS